MGRFLEHSRVWYFENDGQPEVFIGSADLMERNLNKRVEAVCPVRDTELAQFIRHVVLEAYLRDNVRARVLQPDGSYVPVEVDGPPFDAQYTMMSRRLRALLARERLGDQLNQLRMANTLGPAKVVFACVANAGRSQMAAAFFNALANPARARAISAGTRPERRVHPEVVTAMGEKGIDLSAATPQYLSTSSQRTRTFSSPWDAATSVLLFPASSATTGRLEDPKGKPGRNHRAHPGRDTEAGRRADTRKKMGVTLTALRLECRRVAHDLHLNRIPQAPPR